uniref:Wsv021-like protein n=1 Tax=Marsupenaeus japonicus endogenous nimavirus TaxID=2133793 RepID=A0A401IP85_9VIRU|nr:MAG: wsv021-like protein [Marsupenaeus japonicus endogenous nimavirus]GBG35426.1 wsv021-like protein [Marsupenaeus japonicus endogenous nimavirus]
MMRISLYWPLIEVTLYIMFILSIMIIVIIWYNKRYQDQHEKYSISKERTKIYPIFLLDRKKPDEKVCVKEYYLNTEEFLLFTILFRTIREFRPLTCKDDLGWYHYVYHISGCVLNDILWSEKNKQVDSTNDSTMHIILEMLSSHDKNQVYVDYIYNLQQGEFDIIQDTNIRGEVKWMIQNIDDLIGDIQVIKK